MKKSDESRLEECANTVLKITREYSKYGRNHDKAEWMKYLSKLMDKRGSPPTINWDVTVSLKQIYNQDTIYITFPKSEFCQSWGGKTLKPECFKKWVEWNGLGKKIDNESDDDIQSYSYHKCKICKGLGEIITSIINWDDWDHDYLNQPDPQEVSLRVELNQNIIVSQSMCVKKKGHAYLKNFEGDVKINFLIRKHPTFYCIKKDLFIKREITLSESIIGVCLLVNYVSGQKVEIKNKPGSILQPKAYVVKGLGMVTSSGNGDLYIDISILYPKRILECDKANVFKALSREMSLEEKKRIGATLPHASVESKAPAFNCPAPPPVPSCKKEKKVYYLEECDSKVELSLIRKFKQLNHQTYNVNIYSTE